MLSPKIKIRILLWSLLGLAVLFFLWRAVVPGGRISYATDFSRDSYFIGKLSPADRIGDSGSGGSRRIVGDPVYFNLRTPRPFNKARLTINYKEALVTPIIEAGVLGDKDLWRYDLEPISNNIINRLALVWDLSEDGGLMLLQREKEFEGVRDFLDNIPPSSETAVYNYDLKTDFIIPGYAADPKQAVSINTALRGAYELYSYIKDEELDFSFLVRDLNRNTDPDPIEIRLYYRDELIDSRSWEDDGIASDNGKPGEDRNLEFKIGGLPEGAYKIEMRVNDDIVTTAIKTRQSKAAFINKLRLFKDEGKEAVLYTDSRNLQATTVYPDRLGAIMLGENTLELKETYVQHTGRAKRASSSDPYAKIVLPGGGIILSGEGTFSFSPEAWFNPRLKRVDEALDINADGINYIIARYTLPREAGDWSTAAAEYDLTGAYREDGAYSFTISIPGLRADDEIDDYIDLGEIGIELEGRGLVDKIKGIFNL